MSSENYRKVRTITKEEYEKYGINRDFLLDSYKKMYLIRKLEEKIEYLYLVRGLLMGPAHLYNGMEAIAIGVTKALSKGDLIVSNHRGHGHAIAIGITPYEIISEMLGFSEGTQKGLSGSMHVAIDPDAGALYSSAIVGSQVPIAVGAAYAFKYRKLNNVVAVFFGDGATTTGALLESLNMSRFLKVPLYLICEDNNYAEYTNIDYTVGRSRITSMFTSFGIYTEEVDGNDVLSVYRSIKDTEELVRGQKNPVAIHAYTYRLSGHSVTDPASYRSKDEVEKWKALDPILKLKERMLKEDFTNEEELGSVEKSIEEDIESAVNEAIKGSPMSIEDAIKIGDP
ncbi:MAG: thiamine pyrophosphate-dependent dehydrogenase E1 component subunit alpha [Nitrososphaeria archaeon]